MVTKAPDPCTNVNDNDCSAILPEFHRLALLLGRGVLAELEQKRVIVVGLGGVGSSSAGEGIAAR
jgi:tRNA A37 threonylcarbamoyladenosine dehydratase